MSYTTHVPCLGVPCLGVPCLGVPCLGVYVTMCALYHSSYSPFCVLCQTVILVIISTGGKSYRADERV